MLKETLKKIGLNDKQIAVFETTYKLGANPASLIANTCGLKRSTAYRILDELTHLGLIKSSVRAGVQTFFIEDEKTLLKYLEQSKAEIDNSIAEYDQIESELKNLKPAETVPPKIKVYDFPIYQNGHKKVLEDIMSEIKKQNLRSIKLIASNTFNESTGGVRFIDQGSHFLNELKKHQILVDTITADGLILLESLNYTQDMDIIPKLPASNGASNIVIVGNTIFIIIYKENVIGVQINHKDMAQVLHFLFNQLKKVKN